MFSDMTLFVVFTVVLVALALPLGRYMTNVFFGENKIVGKFFLPIERIFYRLAGVNEKGNELAAVCHRSYTIQCIWCSFFVPYPNDSTGVATQSTKFWLCGNLAFGTKYGD